MAGCGGWWLETDPGDSFFYEREIPSVVAAAGSSVWYAGSAMS